MSGRSRFVMVDKLQSEFQCPYRLRCKFVFALHVPVLLAHIVFATSNTRGCTHVHVCTLQSHKRLLPHTLHAHVQNKIFHTLTVDGNPAKPMTIMPHASMAQCPAAPVADGVTPWRHDGIQAASLASRKIHTCPLRGSRGNPGLVSRLVSACTLHVPNLPIQW